MKHTNWKLWADQLFGRDLICVYPALVKIMGGNLVDGAWLGRLLYLGAHYKQEWFWHTEAQWTKELFMSYRTIKRARRTALKLGIIEEKVQGLPPRMHYRINYERVAELVSSLEPVESVTQESAFEGVPSGYPGGDPDADDAQVPDTQALLSEQEYTPANERVLCCERKRYKENSDLEHLKDNISPYPLPGLPALTHTCVASATGNGRQNAKEEPNGKDGPKPHPSPQLVTPPLPGLNPGPGRAGSGGGCPDTPKAEKIVQGETATKGRAKIKVDPEVVLEIYKAYPRKIGRGAALKAIGNAIKNGRVTPERLLEKVNQFAEVFKQWPESQKRFCWYPSTWVNGDHWADEPSEWVRTEFPEVGLSKNSQVLREKMDLDLYKRVLSRFTDECDWEDPNRAGEIKMLEELEVKYPHFKSYQ